MMTGGQLLAQSLANLGVRQAYGVPGESYLALLDALYDLKGQLDFIGCRHEGGAAFMAAAAGKLTGQPGICLVTRGPGATNASIGVHTAMQDSAPMILLVGQVARSMRGREAFQELDYAQVFSGLAKWAAEVDDLDRLPEMLARAWKTAVSGRPGPVVLAIPEDVLSSTSASVPLKALDPYDEPCASPVLMTQVEAYLTRAKRPLILMGGCNWNKQGRHDLQTFAEGADIPLISAFRYQDQYDNHSPTFCGEAGVGMIAPVRERILQADCILAINVRFGENTTEGYSLLTPPKPNQTLLHVHASESELGKIYQPDLAIQAGPNAFASSLSRLNISGAWQEWRQRAREDFMASLVAPSQPSPVDMGQVMAYLRDTLAADAILTNGAGNFATWPNKFFLFGPKARLLAPQCGAMGYGIPAALMAAQRYPGRQVVCFAGDGDFQMTGQELATAAQYGLKFIVLVLNNGTYGTIRMHQERTYPGRVSGTDMENPDFAALARAYGLHGAHVATTQDFRREFEAALAVPTAAVLDLNVSAEALTPRQTLSQMRSSAVR